MKKKKSIVIGLALLFVSFLSCDSEDQIDSLNSINGSSSLGKSVNQEPQTTLITKEDIEAESCDEPIDFSLMAGQHIDVGSVHVSNDENYIYIRYEITKSEWSLKETHLFVGDIEEAPFNNGGNPQFGQFTYQANHDFVPEVLYMHPIDDITKEISIIAHAVVVQGGGENTTANETAIAEGQTEFDGDRWGWIISYQPVECDADDNEGSNDGSDDNISENQNDTSGNSDDTDEDGSNDDNGGNDGSNNGTDDGTNSESDDDTIISGIGGTDGTTGTDSSSDQGCMDAYAYSNDIQSTCLIDEFGQWGWTNLVNENSQHYVPGGVNYTYPLYASAFQCDTSNSILIGEMRLNVQGGDGKLYAKVDIVLNNQELSITDINLYFGSEKYPLDERGQTTLSTDAFDINLTDLNQKSFSATWIEWDPESYFIAHVKVCPEGISP